MITGDEGKPMTIFERISDEPCEIKPFLEYLIANHKAHLEYWLTLPNDRDPDKPTARDCVTHHIESFIREIENALRKLDRPR